MPSSSQPQLFFELLGEILVDVLVVPILPPLLGLNFGRRVRIVCAFFELLEIVFVLLQQSQHLGVLNDFFDLLLVLDLLSLLGFLIFVFALG